MLVNGDIGLRALSPPRRRPTHMTYRYLAALCLSPPPPQAEVHMLALPAHGCAQVRNPVFIADCHPSCPTNSFGQPVVLEGASAVPWKQVLVMQLVGYRAFEEVQALFRCARLQWAGEEALWCTGLPATVTKNGHVRTRIFQPSAFQRNVFGSTLAWFPVTWRVKWKFQ